MSASLDNDDEERLDRLVIRSLEWKRRNLLTRLWHWIIGMTYWEWTEE